MRIIFSFLILIASAISAIEASAESAPGRLSVHQARGLMNGKCYEEYAAVSCKKDCTFSLFPTTQAQLELKITQIPAKLKAQFGHFFRAKFSIQNEPATEAKILDLVPIDINEIKARMEKSTGLLKPIPCP